MTVFSSPLVPSDPSEGPVLPSGLAPTDPALPLDEAARLLAEGESVLQDEVLPGSGGSGGEEVAGLDLIDLAPRSVTAPDLGASASLGSAPLSYTGGSIAIVLAENTMTFDTTYGSACPCPMCSMRPSDPTGFGGVTEGSGLYAPGPAGTMNTLATYLNERNSGSGGNDFWDDFWGGGSDVSTPFFNLTGSGNNAKNGVITFNLGNNNFDGNGVAGTEERDSIRNALDVYEDVLGINFVETTAVNADLNFGDWDIGSAYANFNRASDGAISNAWINIGAGWSGGAGAIGDYYFHTALHEIGHVLGLGHQGNYNAGQGSLTYADQAVWANDTIQFTMMSYWAQANYTAPGQTTPSGAFLGSVNVIGPQAVDWLALDRIYNPQGFGIDDGATTGDTTWGFNSSWSSSVAPPVSNLLNNAYSQMSTLLATNTMTIADGGGIDTLDLSGFANNTKIDLRITSGANIAPSFSNVAGLTGNLAIAAGTVIENAVGGAGSELIYGNTAINTLTGNAGNDTMYAGSGGDTAYGGTGNDILYGEDGDDYLDGGDDNDSLYGGADADYLKGGGGADLLEGGTGTDTLQGDAGNDLLRLRSTDGSFADEAYYGGADFDTLELRGAGVYDLRGAIIDGMEEIEFAGEGADVDKWVYITGAQAIGLGAAVIDGNNNSGSDDTIAIYMGNSGTTALDLSGWTFQDWNASSSNTDRFYVYGDFITDVAETVTGSSQDDFIATYGGNDSVNAGGGNDTVYGGEGNDTLDGGAGIDTLFGGSGNDSITSDGDGGQYYGDAGNDTLVSGLGNESMYGGADIDLIDHRAYDGDYTFDMATGLTNYSGELYTGFEIVYMGDGNDSVTGTNNGDTIYGGVGNDTIIGLGGLDTVYGGSGDDTVYWRFAGVNGASGSSYFGNTGIDMIHGGGTSFGSAATFNLGAGTYDSGLGFTQTWSAFEYYFNNGTGHEIVIGNNANNRLETGSGNNRLEGGIGTDTLLGGGGNDTLLGGSGTDDVYGGDGDDLIQVLAGEFYDNVYGGTGNDTLDHSAATYSGTTFDFSLGTMTGTGILGGTATLAGIEIYQDGSGSNTMVSSGSGEAIYGNDGNDTMIAESGADNMHGGAGIDLLDLSRGDFVYTFDTETGLSVEYGSLETFSGFEQFLFGAANDTITTHSVFGNAETVWGGAGDDTIIDRTDTGAGDLDTYDGGTGTDTIVYTFAFPNAGRVIDLSQNGVFFNGQIRDVLLNFENVRIEGGLADIVGNTQNNVLTAIGAFANTISGLDGDDTIDAGAGNDTLDGGAGNDWLDGGAGADSMVGGTGDDTYVVDDVGDVVVEGAGGGTDTVRSFITYGLQTNLENLTLLGASDLVGTGNAVANVMTANSGNTAFYGLAGDDTLIGGVGNDTLNGGNGADSMVGGTGDDVYFVNNGGDVVVEGAGEGTDLVFSFVTHTLAVNVENLTLLGTVNSNGAGNTGDNVIVGNTGDNTLFGLGGHDMLQGGGGNDTLFGGAGADTLDGGNGADSMVGGVGNDTYVVNNAGDIVVEAAGEGIDTVQSFITHTLAANVEHLTLMGANNSSGTGNGANNILTGNDGNNTLSGLDGADTLIGGLGIDTLIGGNGADTFVFSSAAEAGLGATRDRITDFVSGQDKIDLSGFAVPLNFIGGAVFTGTAGDLRYFNVGGIGNLAGDLDGDTIADFGIVLSNGAVVIGGDLIL